MDEEQTNWLMTNNAPIAVWMREQMGIPHPAGTNTPPGAPGVVQGVLGGMGSGEPQAPMGGPGETVPDLGFPQTIQPSTQTQNEYEAQQARDRQAAANMSVQMGEIEQRLPTGPGAPGTAPAPSIQVIAHPSGMAMVRGQTPDQQQQAAQFLQSMGMSPPRMMGQDLVLDQNQLNVLSRNGIAGIGQGAFPAVIQQMAGFAPQGTGTGESTRTQLGLQIHAPVPQQILAEADMLGDKLQALRQEALMGQLDANQALAEGAAGLASLRENQAAQLESQEAQRGEEFRSRLDALDNSILELRQNRIDPEAFFGSGGSGFGNRMGAGIAVALGELARNFSGDGVNRASQIIESRINQNIAAQSANQSNARAVVGLQFNALSQYRALLGDERAAQAAVRAAGWEAAITRLQSTIRSSANPVMQANGHALILAARMNQIQSLMAVYQNAWSMSTTTTTRGGPSATDQLAALQPQAPAAPEPELSPLQRLQAMESVPGNASQQALDQAAATGQAPARPRPRGALERLRQLEGVSQAFVNELDPGASRPRVQPSQPVRPFATGQELGETNVRAERLGQLGAEGAGIPQTPPGWMLIPGQDTRFAQAMSDPETRHRIESATVVVNTLFNDLNQIMEIRRGVGGETFDTPEGSEMKLRAMNIMNGIRQGTGMGALDRGAQEFLESRFPEPTERAVQDLAGFDHIINSYLGAFRGLQDYYENTGRSWGLEFDNELNRTLRARQAEARRQGP